MTLGTSTTSTVSPGSWLGDCCSPASVQPPRPPPPRPPAPRPPPPRPPPPSGLAFKRLGAFNGLKAENKSTTGRQIKLLSVGN